jgi:hypothetical protein
MILLCVFLAGQSLALSQSLLFPEHHPWERNEISMGPLQHLCALIVRIVRLFHVVLFMILVDKPGILQKKLQLPSKYRLFSAMTDVGKLVQG